MAAKYPRFEMMKVAALQVHPDGVRQSSEEAVFNVGRCLVVLGVLRTLTVNARTGHVLDGDIVLEHLRARGDSEVPVWVVDIPEELEEVAHLALNNHAGEWVWEKVSRHLQALNDAEVAGTFKDVKAPLPLTGFRSHDIAPLLEADWKTAGATQLGDDDKQQLSML